MQGGPSAAADGSEAMSNAKRNRKKKQVRRLGCLLGLVVLAFGAVAALILLLRPAAEPGEGTPLSAEALWDGSWYEDDLGRIEGDRSLVRGMKTFEKRTGSKPYLSLQNGIAPEELDVFAAEQYEALFDEGDHLLVIYDEWEDGVYYLSARTGPNGALTVEDRAKLLDCLERAYADPANKSYADAFGAGFRQAAREVSGKGGGGAWLLAALGAILMALAVILVLFLRKKARPSVRWAEEDS